MAYKPLVLKVVEGGTGVATNNAYGVIVGGTSSTGAFQSVAPGASGTVLISGGASALPSFQSASGGTVIFLASQKQSPVADSTTYFLLHGRQWTTSGAIPQSKFFIPSSGTITAVYGKCFIGTLATNESVTIDLRLNNTTDTNITSSYTMDASGNSFSNTGLSIAVVAGDYVGIKITTPAFATNPNNVAMSVSIVIS
jgi:hypothetical protein